MTDLDTLREVEEEHAMIHMAFHRSTGPDFWVWKRILQRSEQRVIEARKHAAAVDRKRRMYAVR